MAKIKPMQMALSTALESVARHLDETGESLFAATVRQAQKPVDMHNELVGMLQEFAIATAGDAAQNQLMKSLWERARDLIAKATN